MTSLQETLDEAGLGGRRLEEEIAGRYKLVDPLGQGGVGQVFSARDLRSNRLVALKLLKGETAQTLFRLKNEFRTLTELQHRNIVVPYELFFHEDLLCYSMELVDGVSIVEYCRGHDTSVGSRDTFFQLVDALETIHDSGIVHRDLKPANILVTRGGRVVLLDFGVSKSTGRGGITREMSWVGTPTYMAPEQFRGAEPSAATDWYAFGAVVYECLTGRAAFPQLSVPALLAAKEERKIVGQPRELENSEAGALIRALLDPDPSSRPGPPEVRVHLRQPAVAARPRVVKGVAAVGRKRELSLLDHQLQRVKREGRVGVASVLGEEGMGKTRLVEAFRADVRKHESAFVASARCSTAETLPLRLVDSLLDDLISQASYDARVPIERCYPRHGAELCATFPCAAVLFGKPDQTSPTDPRRRRELALRAVADLLARVSEHVPVLLIFDDLQNNDEDGFDVLLRLVLELAECPVLFVLAGSTAANERIDVLLTAARNYLGAGAVAEIALGAMTQGELCAIAWEELWSWRGPAEVVDVLCTKSDGNPGLCVWYVRALLRDSTEPLPLGADDIDRHVFQRAWGLLSESAKDLLAYVAIAGQALPRALLVQLLDGGADEVDTAVRDLEHHAFLRRHRYEGTEDLRLSHRHIARHVESLFSADELRGKHGSLARVLANAGDASAGRAAHHFRVNGVLDHALDQLEVAIGVARREQTHRRACELLEQALELSAGDPDRRRRFEVALADSLGAAGRLRRSAELSARLCKDPALEDSVRDKLRLGAIGHYGALADAAQVRALVAEDIGRGYDPGSALLRLVGLRLRISARPPWSQRSWGAPPQNWERQLEVLWTAGSRLLHIDPIYAAYLISKHLLLSFQSGSAAHQARALSFEAVMTTAQGEKKLDHASTLLAEAERTANACDDDRVRAFVHQGAGFMWGNVGRYREAIAEGRSCVEAFQRAPDTLDYEQSHARVELGWRFTQVGSHREILSSVPDLIRRAVESEDPVLASAFHVQAANAYIAADRGADAARHLDEAERWCPATYEAGKLGLFLTRLASRLYAGRTADAREMIDVGRGAIEALRILKLPAVKTAYAYRVGTALCWSLERGVATDARGTRRLLGVLRKELSRQVSDVAKAQSRLLDAGALSLEGRHERARGLLRESIDRFATLGWENISALASIRYRELQGSLPDPDALALLDRFGVAEPTRWAQAMIPPIGTGYVAQPER